MSDKSEDALFELVSSEQRGFRRILFAGFGILFVLIAMSAALGIYYYSVSNRLQATLTETSDRLDRGAFEARLAADRQTNQVSNLERAVRRTYEEFRQASATKAVPAAAGASREAVGLYLRRGGRTFANERLIESPDRTDATLTPNLRALLAGAAVMLAWERNGEQIDASQKGLPENLAKALASFEQAAADPALTPLAQNGLAWVHYIDASSNRSNYDRGVCEKVFAAVAASAMPDRQPSIGPQPLYWRAQCERKLGMTREALRDYVLALEQSGKVSSTSNEAELTLAMNAFHGAGTQIITTFDTPDAELRAEFDTASQLCGTSVEGDTGSPRMLLARACLAKAIDLRQRLRQTRNQVSGSGENVSFSYLRDGDFEGAYSNAVSVSQTGLFPWNELLRALSAEHVAATATDPAVKAKAEAAAGEARRNVTFFPTGRFNPCELPALLDEKLLAEAKAIVEAQHRKEKEEKDRLLVCNATPSAEAPAPPKS